MPKGDHVMAGNEHGPCLHCTHCGESFPMPVGEIGSWFVGVSEAFQKAHRHCKPGEERSVRLCGLQELPGVYPGIPLEGGNADS